MTNSNEIPTDNTLKANLFPVSAKARTVDLGTCQLPIDCLQYSVMYGVIVVKWTFTQICLPHSFYGWQILVHLHIYLYLCDNVRLVHTGMSLVHGLSAAALNHQQVTYTVLPLSQSGIHLLSMKGTLHEICPWSCGFSSCLAEHQRIEDQCHLMVPLPFPTYLHNGKNF